MNQTRESSVTTNDLLDTHVAVRLLLQRMDEVLFPALEQSIPLPLAVAGKDLSVMTLPLLPGNHQKESQSITRPYIHYKDRTRDSWHKDRLFGIFFVSHGEADLLLSRKILTSLAGQFGYIAPFTMRSYGATPHWERPNVKESNSELIWLFIGEDGGSIHCCRTSSGVHAISPIIFIPDGGLLQLIELFSCELDQNSAGVSSRVLLWLIFERVRRRLLQGKAISQYTGEQQLQDARQKPTYSAAKRAQRYIDANLAQRLTLEKVAHAVHVSRTTLALSFPKETGKTFTEYLTERRLELAQNLLKTTTLPMAEIASHCGFANPQYFSELFRRHCGVSPTEFRRNSER